jgi:hypothetical protein
MGIPLPSAGRVPRFVPIDRGCFSEEFTLSAKEE